ncbi:MAG: glucosamine-6-phosphate deaminase [Candidatus Firestonebacteria bacterium]
MEVIVVKDYEEMSKEGAKIVRDAILEKPNLVLGLATGSTPIGLYKELIRMHKQEKLSFKRVVTFNLDEYIGLDKAHPQSYWYFMHDNLFNHIDIPKKNIHVPDGKADDIEKFCLWYEKEMEKLGGIDLQVLGIGRDGHIAFNEPGSSLGSRTRIKTLTKETIEDNARFFKNMDEVPKFAITMGVGTIMDAKHCLMLANGANKAGVLAATVEGSVTAQVTASVLQLHSKVTTICDEASSTCLKRKDYYKWITENKYKVPKSAKKASVKSKKK